MWFGGGQFINVLSSWFFTYTSSNFNSQRKLFRLTPFWKDLSRVAFFVFSNNLYSHLRIKPSTRSEEKSFLTLNIFLKKKTTLLQNCSQNLFGNTVRNCGRSTQLTINVNFYSLPRVFVEDLKQTNQKSFQKLQKLSWTAIDGKRGIWWGSRSLLYIEYLKIESTTIDLILSSISPSSALSDKKNKRTGCNKHTIQNPFNPHSLPKSQPSHLKLILYVKLNFLLNLKGLLTEHVIRT